MTGSLRAFGNPPPRRPHDHVDIVLDSGLTLRYHDPRRFGAMLWLPPPAEAHPLLAGLGPEPFDPACDADYLWRATRRRSTAIKLALMDNHLVVGVGNIYANESLFRGSAHHAGEPPVAARSRGCRRGPRHADRSHRQGRVDVARLRGQPGEPGYFSSTTPYGRRGCLPTRRRHTRDPARRRPRPIARAASAEPPRDPQRRSAAIDCCPRRRCRHVTPVCST
jgi:formamidopyrimidine-DNA glycosylase